MFQVGAVIDGGRASAGGTATLTDATKVWGTDLLAGFLVRIISGTGVNQIRQVASNTATVLTVSANWTTNPDATSEYAIFLSANITITTGAINNVSILTTTTVVLGGAATRVSVALSNDSNEDIYVAVGTAAVMNKGILLRANGGQVVLGLGKAALAINAICLSGTKNLAYQTFSNA